ncbi:hypothetical protein H9P43_003121 [Blastocladiella emersonii ATCC 22665]|nr:hypothetical protein H9P43_003121 [Blastocladiella emersonii ATCC 22665]
MLATNETFKHLSSSELEILQSELDSLDARARVYQRRVGNSNVLFLTNRLSLDKTVDETLRTMLVDAPVPPPFATLASSKTTAEQPIKAATASAQPAPAPAPASPATKTQPQPKTSPSKKGKGKGKRGGRR